MTAKKKQPWYASLNQPPRSIRNGNNRRTNPPVHGNPTDRTSDSTGGSGTDNTFYALPGFIPVRTGRTPAAGTPAGAIPHTGIRTGELTAFRAWYVVNDYELRSLAHHFIWEPGATVSGDVNELVDNWLNVMGVANVMGGIYGHKTPSQTLEDVRENWQARYPLREHRVDVTQPPFRLLGWLTGWQHRLVGGDAVVTVDDYLGMAMGTVKMWGEIVEHQKGYRAQYAKLTSIDRVCGVVDGTKLRAKYGV